MFVHATVDLLQIQRTGFDDAAALSEGIRRTYTETNLRYSQVAPLSMYQEVNTGDNLPAQIDLYTEPGDECGSEKRPRACRPRRCGGDQAHHDGAEQDEKRGGKVGLGNH